MRPLKDMIASGKGKMPIVQAVCEEMLSRIRALTAKPSFKPSGLAAHHMNGTINGLKLVLCCTDKMYWDLDGYLKTAIHVMKTVDKTDVTDIAGVLCYTASLSPEYKPLYDEIYNNSHVLLDCLARLSGAIETLECVSDRERAITDGSLVEFVNEGTDAVSMCLSAISFCIGANKECLVASLADKTKSTLKALSDGFSDTVTKDGLGDRDTMLNTFGKVVREATVVFPFDKCVHELSENLAALQRESQMAACRQTWNHACQRIVEEVSTSTLDAMRDVVGKVRGVKFAVDSPESKHVVAAVEHILDHVVETFPAKACDPELAHLIVQMAECSSAIDHQALSTLNVFMECMNCGVELHAAMATQKSKDTPLTKHVCSSFSRMLETFDKCNERLGAVEDKAALSLSRHITSASAKIPALRDSWEADVKKRRRQTHGQ